MPGDKFRAGCPPQAASDILISPLNGSDHFLQPAPHVRISSYFYSPSMTNLVSDSQCPERDATTLFAVTVLADL